MQQFNLIIDAKQNVTLVPRILQILSRRGYTLEELKTIQISGTDIRLKLMASGDPRWHDQLIRLIGRLIDVTTVIAVDDASERNKT